MSNGLENAISRTRMLAGLSKARELSDRQLLEQFADGDENSFSALVDRYGGQVMGICQRVVQHTQDAEDAFQATFMVLAKKADKVAWDDSVANWLHGVACRIAFQVRREKVRRQARERNANEPAAAGPDPTWSELKPVLDEELDRLPAKYRIPLILCCLEGMSRDEAAAQLGWSAGSVKGRLERGRELLRSRLARRGLTLSAALAATLISTASAKASVPLTLGLETVRAGMAMQAGQLSGVVSTQALTLAQGVLHAMFMSKLKFAAAVVLTVLTLALGTGYVSHQALAGGERQPERIGNGDRAASNERTPSALDAAQRERPKEAPTVTGIVHTIDAEKQTIVLLISRENKDRQAFDIAKDVKVLLREGRETKAAKLADVQPKARVILTLDDAKKTVTMIVIGRSEAPGERPERTREDGNLFRGYVTEIDANKRTITFQAGGREQPATTKTFDLAKDVKVTIRTGRLVKEGKLNDVPLKTTIQVKLDEAKKTVQSIEVMISTTAMGSVSEIGANSIILTRGREATESKSYALSKNVKVRYRMPGGGEGRGAENFRDALLADVVVGSTAIVQLDDELKVVKSIEVQLPTIRGVLQEMDAKKGTLVLRGPRDMDVKATVAKDAMVLVNGKAGEFARIGIGADLHLVLSPDRTQVLAIITPIPMERGREE